MLIKGTTGCILVLYLFAFFFNLPNRWSKNQRSCIAQYCYYYK